MVAHTTLVSKYTFRNILILFFRTDLVTMLFVAVNFFILILLRSTGSSTGSRCSGDDFKCKNGRCILKTWRCDKQNDCVDNSDEEDCHNACTSHEFKCESNGSCIDEMLKCDGRADCFDSSDEKDCPHLRAHANCKNMFSCNDGSCIYDYEVCDGHTDCRGEEDELNCTHSICQPDELLCPSKRCISKSWICDGDADCKDESDEQNCDQSKVTQKPKPTPVTDSTCDTFFCYLTGQCLPWNKVCDGQPDCDDSFDEGKECSRACVNNGGCSHVCQKMPYGSKCFCLEGYRLLPDNKTCDDIDECETIGTCSHFCNNTKGGFKCTCAQGYVLHDHNFCKAEGSATLVYLMGNQIRGLDLHSNTKHVIVNATDVDMQGMDYNSQSAVFFWTNKYGASINLYSPKTGNLSIVIRSSLTPTDISYDWITGNMYLKNASSTIVACTKDVRYCKTLIKPSKSLINNIEIAPYAGLMFWTVWANEKQKQDTGSIERAEMDGSHQTLLVHDKILAPSGISVDRILNKIYWTDQRLNTLECTDFHGLRRKHVIQSGMYHPMAVAVFEDNVYWADYGTDSIIKCNKFTGQDCVNVTETNVKAQKLLIVHKAMQPQGVNKCSDANCTQLCLLTRSGSVCACDDIDKTSCSVESELTTPISVITCPRDYCHGDGECVVKDGQYRCKCQPPYFGEKCDAQARASVSNPDNSWIVAVVLAITITAVMIISIVMCIRNRDRLQKVGESVSVKFLNPKSDPDGRQVMDTDDGNICDELVIEKDGDYKKVRGNSDYTNSETVGSDLKKLSSYGRDFTFNAVGNFFRKLKLNDTML